MKKIIKELRQKVKIINEQGFLDDWRIPDGEIYFITDGKDIWRTGKNDSADEERLNLERFMSPPWEEINDDDNISDNISWKGVPEEDESYLEEPTTSEEDRFERYCDETRVSVRKAWIPPEKKDVIQYVKEFFFSKGNEKILMEKDTWQLFKEQLEKFWPEG